MRVRAGMGRLVLVLALDLALVRGAASARAASAGADPSLTGVPAAPGMPAEGNCTACHASAALNPDAAGKIELLGLPERYAPGERYALTLRLSHPDAARGRWGFQLTAVDAKTLHGAGELVVTDAATTQRLDGGPGGRQYLEQTIDGTAIGQAGEQHWRFTWVAPARDVGGVAFYASGNAANADGSNQGDFIFNPTPAPLATVQSPSPGGT